jgi:membrane protein YdbS with pleckstrin-like domain
MEPSEKSSITMHSETLIATIFGLLIFFTVSRLIFSSWRSFPIAIVLLLVLVIELAVTRTDYDHEHEHDYEEEEKLASQTGAGGVKDFA